MIIHKWIGEDTSKVAEMNTFAAHGCVNKQPCCKCIALQDPVMEMLIKQLCLEAALSTGFCKATLTFALLYCHSLLPQRNAFN